MSGGGEEYKIRRKLIENNLVEAILVLPQDMSVSYTHLRAHETVLDLVCRLLLEKKKKKQTVEVKMREHNKNLKH